MTQGSCKGRHRAMGFLSARDEQVQSQVQVRGLSVVARGVRSQGCNPIRDYNQGRDVTSCSLSIVLFHTSSLDQSDCGSQVGAHQLRPFHYG